MKAFQEVHISAKDVAGYVLLPGIVPRVKDLFNIGFGWLAHLMALIYFAARLLPYGHPYLDSANIGRFGVRQVIAEAASHLVIKKENIDQILIFIILMAGLVLLAVQFVFIIFNLITNPALAQVGMFRTDLPEKDIAFMLMDQVFAVPGMFGSKYDADVIGITPFNTGLHGLFQFYSTALLVVGVLIFLYYLMVVVGETATTGTPFGKRFASVWAPIRLVVALGLLVPIHHGLNSAQYITLYAAKWGSGFATNAWLGFNNNLVTANGNLLAGGEGEDVDKASVSMLARPRDPDIQYLVQFMSLVNACRALNEYYYQDKVYFEGTADQVTGMKIRPYLVKILGSKEITATGASYSPTWEEAVAFHNKGDIIIRFGHDGAKGNAHLYPKEIKGGVKPVCGEIKIPTTLIEGDQIGLGELAVAAEKIQEAYYQMVIMLWTAAGKDSGVTGLTEMEKFVELIELREKNESVQVTTGDLKNTLINETFQPLVEVTIDEVYNLALEFGKTQSGLPLPLRERGWAGAGIWYNYIAQWNGALFDAVRQIPVPVAMPLVMEDVAEQRRKAVATTSPQEQYAPNVDVTLNGNELKIAQALNLIYQDWTKNNTNLRSDEIKTSNIFMDVVSMMFGIEGLFAMREQDSVHPMAQLTAVGKSIMDNSVMYLMVSTGLAVSGGVLSVLENAGYGSAASAFSEFFVSLTSIGLSTGFLLYYILPFLPFIYFFFAVGSWVKTIFEAMVGVPLWALAHIRIDGHGLSGEAASNGYFLIFEIFIRPILTVFGLLAGIIIFTAMVRTLNGIFDLVTLNMSGFNDEGDLLTAVLPGATPEGSTETTIIGIEYKRGVIDEFFFTIMYAVIVYMMATASFKMIDAVPNSILRWMGAGVRSFGDDRDDPTGKLVQWAAFGGASVAQQATGIINKGGQLTGQTVGQFFKRNGQGLSATRVQGGQGRS